MNVKLVLSVAAATFLTASPSAADFLSGYIDFSISQITEGDSESRFGINGGAEFVLSSSWNAQVNSGLNSFSGADDSQADLSGHLIYTPLDFFAAGAFVGICLLYTSPSPRDS